MDKRVHPIYFPYPWQEVDEITVQLPEGYKVGEPPQKADEYAEVRRLPKISHEIQGRTLRLKRRFVMQGTLFPVKYYAHLRVFFNAVRKGDEQQVVLQAAETDR